MSSIINHPHGVGFLKNQDRGY